MAQLVSLMWPINERESSLIPSLTPKLLDRKRARGALSSPRGQLHGRQECPPPRLWTLSNLTWVCVNVAFKIIPLDPVLAGWHYLDPQEDADIPRRDVQNVIGQVVAAGTPGQAILLPALAITVRAEHTITPLLGAREEHIWASQGESSELRDFNHTDGWSSRSKRPWDRNNCWTAWGF